MITPTGEGAWYAVHTKPKQENRALENLQNQGFECFLPLLEVEKIRRGKVQKVVEPMFSRYLFIQLNETSQKTGRPFAPRWVLANWSVLGRTLPKFRLS